MRHLRYSFYGASVALSAGSCQFKGMTWTVLLDTIFAMEWRRIFDLSSVIAGYHEFRIWWTWHDLRCGTEFVFSMSNLIIFFMRSLVKKQIAWHDLGCGTEFAPEITTSILHSREQAIRRLLGHTAWETLNIYYIAPLYRKLCPLSAAILVISVVAASRDISPRCIRKSIDRLELIR